VAALGGRGVTFERYAGLDQTTSAYAHFAEEVA